MTKDDARNQAQAQLESIRGMVFRLEHAQDCPGDEFCDLDDATILEGLNIHPSEQASADDRAAYHDEDGARQAILEDALDVQVRSDWGKPGDLEPGEYMILLCTGGPAVRIIGQLDSCYPASAQIEYQDWGTPWTALPTSSAEEADLLTYASQFYYGE